MSFADRLIVMRNGKIEQDGSPEAVYHQPKTAFVAHFLGKTNLISAHAKDGHADTPFGRLKVSGQGNLKLSIRPEQLCFADSGLAVQILAREFKGHDLSFSVQSQHSPNLELLVHTDAQCRLQVGDHAHLQLRGEAVVVGL
jgi:iron(III) transport system ATP-binding protein